MLWSNIVPASQAGPNGEKFYKVLQGLKDQIVLDYLRGKELGLNALLELINRIFPETGPAPELFPGDEDFEETYVAHHKKSRKKFIDLQNQLQG